MVMRPPSGMASRALTTRLRMAFSSWLTSTNVGHRPLPSMVSTAIVSPTVRVSISDRLATNRFKSTCCGLRTCWRENASRRWVSEAARLAPCIAAAIGLPIDEASAGPPRARRRSAESRLPMTTVMRLLKSWAIPPASWPIDSIFWVCARMACASLRTRVSSASASVRWRNSRISAPLNKSGPRGACKDDQDHAEHDRTRGRFGCFPLFEKIAFRGVKFVDNGAEGLEGLLAAPGHHGRSGLGELAVAAELDRSCRCRQDVFDRQAHAVDPRCLVPAVGDERAQFGQCLRDRGPRLIVGGDKPVRPRQQEAALGQFEVLQLAEQLR